MAPLSQHIWETRYRYTNPLGTAEGQLTDTWERVARAVAAAENDPAIWTPAFYDLLADFRFLPGGRILAGAGTAQRVTLFNCFVMGRMQDSLKSIFECLKQSAVTMQQGGGIGCDFSPLRPAGCPALTSGAIASGPVSFMHSWNTMCETLLGTSSRGGAMMATLRCDHPDIEAFIDAKRQPQALNNFNLSVLLTDDFMQALADNADWELKFPHAASAAYEPRFEQVRHKLPARQLWNKIVGAAHASAEPGVLFIDTINRENNLWYCEQINATNPCGEVPLPPYGACDLGSINLTALVREPFTRSARLDRQLLRNIVSVAVRFLDDIIDISHFPLPRQAEQARNTRRIGLGISGLADALVMLGLHYDSEAARALASRTMRLIRDTAYAASIDLAREKSRFPSLEPSKYLQAPFIRRLPDRLRADIANYGIRNSHLLAIAPTGTISLLAGNISGGIEPIYALEAQRELRRVENSPQRFVIPDHAYALWRDRISQPALLPEFFVTADALAPRAHLEMQACLQKFVDNAISKTINLAEDASAESVAQIFSAAHELGIKGCTVFRSGARSGQVLRTRDQAHCCHFDREAD